MKYNTRLLHGNLMRKNAEGSTLPPVYLTNAFEQETPERMERVFENKAPGFVYSRVGNPTVAALENRITLLEGGVGSVACASGMSAIHNCLMNFLQTGDAGIIRFQGQLMTYVPGEGPCYRCVFQTPPPPDAVPTCKQAGVIGAMGGVIGSLQAMEAVKYLLGVGDLLVGRLLTYDALKMEFRTIKLPARGDGCAVCSDHPTITELIDYKQKACEGI